MKICKIKKKRKNKNIKESKISKRNVKKRIIQITLNENMFVNSCDEKRIFHLVKNHFFSASLFIFVLFPLFFSRTPFTIQCFSTCSWIGKCWSHCKLPDILFRRMCYRKFEGKISFRFRDITIDIFDIFCNVFQEKEYLKDLYVLRTINLTRVHSWDIYQVLIASPTTRNTFSVYNDLRYHSSWISLILTQSHATQGISLQF